MFNYNHYIINIMSNGGGIARLLLLLAMMTYNQVQSL